MLLRGYYAARFRFKSSIIEEFDMMDNRDTGSAEVQVALLTRRIKDLTEHLKAHKHDYASTRG